MSVCRPQHSYLCFLTATVLLSVAVARLGAEPINSVNADRAATRAVASRTIEAIPIPQPEGKVIVQSPLTDTIDDCHVYRPAVQYRVKGHCPPCCVAKEPVEVLMMVKDPARCDCYAEVAVCLPSCCAGEATICNRAGVLGRRWVDYEWECGFKISVLFRTRGDVVVNYIF